MRNYIIIITVALFGFFTNFEFLGDTGNIILKVFLFFALGYVLYTMYNESESAEVIEKTPPANQNVKTTPPKVSFKSTFIYDGSEGIAELLNDKELALNSFIISQFEILLNYYVPKNGYIFLQTTNEHVRIFYKSINAHVTWQESTEIPHFIKLIKNHDDDILVENNLTTQSKILPYYDPNNYSPGSVFGLKINLVEKQAFYFVFDAPATGFFNEEEFGVPVQINFTLQYVIKNALVQQALKQSFLDESTKLKLMQKLNTSSTKDALIAEYVEFLAEIFEANKLTIALLDKNNRNIAEIVKTVGQLDSIKEGTRFAIDEGLCGKVIANNQVYLIDDIEKDGYFIPRFSKNEKTNFGLRSFLGIPLLIDGDPAGMISLEHNTPNAFHKQHKELLKNYTQYFEAALTRFAKKKGDD